MCGIAGVVALAGTLGRDDHDTAMQMNELLRHRGPDDVGQWKSEKVGLCHRRLSIIETSTGGHQPMESSSGRYVVSYNGELYNYRELADELTSTGWSSTGRSDTAILLQAVERWGLTAALERFDGMFAFALYDRSEESLHLVRDRFGEKPLVTTEAAGRLWFGSETRVMSVIPSFERRISPAAVRSYLRFGYIPGDTSVFEGVTKVQPGEIVTVDCKSGSIARSRFWTLGDAPDRSMLDDDEVSHRVEQLLDRSVRRRMNSDRPLGTFLSGGIDSALTSTLAARHVDVLDTFTMAWESREYDESARARAISERIGSRHHEIRIGATDLLPALDHLANDYDEPFADSSALAVHAVAAFARKSVVVCLSGDGGDELFAGYNRHRWLLRTRSATQRIPTGLLATGAALTERSARLVDLIMRPIPPDRRPRLVKDKVGKLARALRESDPFDAYQAVIAMSPTVPGSRTLDQSIVAGLRDESDRVFMGALRRADIASYLPDDILTKVDRATMGLGLECRTPFLEADLVDFALSLDPRQLIDRSGGKRPLRRLLAKLLPDLRHDQSKAGFGVPIGDLMRGPLSGDMADAVDVFRQRQFAPELDLSATVDRLASGDDSGAPLLWSVVMFERWARLHAPGRIDREVAHG